MGIQAGHWRIDELPEELRRLRSSTGARHGTTCGMRGYYAFSPHRNRYAVARSTPAIIIEMGFVTVARGIGAGIVSYLSRHDPLDREALAVRSYPAMRVARERAELSFHPEEDSKVAGRLEGGTLVRPVHRRSGWVEVIVWGNYRRFGWMRESDLEMLGGSS